MLSAWTEAPVRLRADIINTIKKGTQTKVGGTITTWEIGPKDVLIHIAEQWKPEGGFEMIPDTSDPDKNAHRLDFKYISFQTAKKPDKHATQRYLEGRLLEMLLVHFRDSFSFISAE